MDHRFDAPAQDWTIGLIGYGEVGRILAEDLRARGVIRLLATDHKLGGPDDGPLVEHAGGLGVRLMPDAASLATSADLVISAVTASQAVVVAGEAASGIGGGIGGGRWFLDLNSASPQAKRDGAERIQAAGGRYVEGAVMTSVPPYRIRVPMLLGGPDAAELAPALAALGFDATVADARLGVASATKMCRSVMIKGLEAMVIESFTAARAYGVEDAVITSLVETFPGLDWEQLGAYFFQRVIQHGRRRAEEMREVAETVRDIGLHPWSASGTAERQGWIADLADQGVFGARDGAEFAKASDWRVEADRLLNRNR